MPESVNRRLKPVGQTSPDARSIVECGLAQQIDAVSDLCTDAEVEVKYREKINRVQVFALSLLDFLDSVLERQFFGHCFRGDGAASVGLRDRGKGYIAVQRSNPKANS